MWKTPKTDWVSSDVFLHNADYARLCGNLQTLCTLGAVLYGGTPAAPSADAPADGYLTREYFNAPERATQQLMQAAAPFVAYAERTLAADEPVWTHADINRIEGAHAQLYAVMDSALQCAPRLCFTLGGDGL